MFSSVSTSREQLKKLAVFPTHVLKEYPCLSYWSVSSIVEKISPIGFQIRSPLILKNGDFNLLTIIAATLTMISIVTMLTIVNVAAINVSKSKSRFFLNQGRSKFCGGDFFNAFYKQR